MDLINDSQGWRREIRERLYEYGIDSESFLEKVRKFFFDGQQHYYRVGFQKFISEIMEVELLTETSREEFLHKIAKDMGIDRKIRARWKTGEDDLPIAMFIGYYSRLGVSMPPEMFADGLSPVRWGISRTLTYIRVFPPGKPNSRLPSDAKIPDSLKRCWSILRRHVHYRKHGDLNQHAVDFVYRAFRDELAITDPCAVKQRLEKTPDEDDSIFWPWIIFKAATIDDILISTKPKDNPHRWIWDSQSKVYNLIWEGCSND